MDFKFINKYNYEWGVLLILNVKILLDLLWYDVNAALGWWKMHKRDWNIWAFRFFLFNFFFFFGWACAAKTVLLGLIFDLWAVNQIWSPVPCEESICDTHKTECERTKMAGSVYRLWLYLSCLSMYHHILKLSLFVSKIIFIF